MDGPNCNYKKDKQGLKIKRLGTKMVITEKVEGF
jgi:hypothetical protein